VQVFHGVAGRNLTSTLPATDNGLNFTWDCPRLNFDPGGTLESYV